MTVAQAILKLSKFFQGDKHKINRKPILRL